MKGKAMVKYCSNPNCLNLARSDQPVALDANLDVCPACGNPLTLDNRGIPQASPIPWRKMWVTLGILAVCLAARHIALPTVRFDTWPDDQAAFRAGATSIMALGVLPLLQGYVLVELAALLIPAWRPLRVGGPAGRAKLHRASLMAGMLLATFHAFTLSIGLERMGWAGTPGAWFRILTVLTLLGATAVLVALAWIVDRDGLGNGFSILLLADLVPGILVPLGNGYKSVQSGLIQGPASFTGLLFVAALAAATLWMFSRHRLPASDSLHHPSLVSRPACGVAPLSTFPAVSAMVAVLIGLNHPSQPFGPGSPGYLFISLVLSIAAAALFAFLFNPPDGITQIWTNLLPDRPENIPRLKAVMLESVLFTVLVMLVEVWAVRRVGAECIPSPVAVLLVTGILSDLVREWRAELAHVSLKPIWEIHQSYKVAPTLSLLEAEGIAAFAKGRRLRALLQFFGPYIPVWILVPAEHAQRAHALIQSRWPDHRTPVPQAQNSC